MTKTDDRSRDPGRGQIALARSLPLLIFTLCAVGVIVVLAFRNYSGLNLSAAIFDTTAPVCAGSPALETATFRPESETHPSVAFLLPGDGRIQPNRDFIPAGWQPTDVSEVELVLCLENERPSFRPLCDNAAIISPIGREVEVTLRAAKTAEILATGLITSNPAAQKDCLAEVPPLESATPQRFPADPVQDWLLTILEN